MTRRQPLARWVVLPGAAAPAACIALALALTSCAPAGPKQGSGKLPLRWGGDAEGGAPFVEADPADASKVRGFDVEIAGMFAHGLGREPQFVQVAWPSINQSIERGDFDVGMSGVEDRAEFHQRYAVTIPYFEFLYVLAVRPADSLKYRTLADLAGKRVSTLAATRSYDMLLEEQKRTGVIPVSYDDDVHPYSDLVTGRVEAVLLDNVIADRALARTGGFIIQRQPVETGHYVALLRKDRAPLRDSLNAILRARMADGSLERLFRQWHVWDSTQSRYYQHALSDSAKASTGVVSANATNKGALAYLPSLLKAAGITLVLSVLAMGLAVVVGVAIAAGRLYGPPIVRGVLMVYVEVTRGTPVLLQLFVLYYALSSVVRLPAFLAAVSGLGLNYAAYESEIYRAALKAIAAEQLEAARTLGFTEFQILRLIRGPQALRLALAPMTNDFVALLKDSSLVSVITVVELTKQTSIFAANIGSWVVPGTLCAILYLALSLPLSRVAVHLERRWNTS